jgi:Short C-terminal domain
MIGHHYSMGMFGRKKHSDLPATGMRAAAELIDIRFGRTFQTNVGGVGGNESRTSSRVMTVRVEPRNGTPYHAELHLSRKAPMVPTTPGTRFEVLVDPDDPSHLELLADPVFTLPNGASWRPPANLGVGRAASDAAMQQARDIAQRAAQARAAAAQAAAAQPGPPAAGRAEAPADPVDQLVKLSDLYDRGLLTEAEFTAQKAQILEQD